jgi:chemotaxis protein MotA
MAVNGKRAAKPDITTLAGLVLGVGGILLGQRLEGGDPSQIFGLSAAVIVLGGTIGAVLVSTPFGTLKRAIVRLKDVLFEVPLDAEAMIDDVLELAVKARKNGIVSLETEAAEIPNRFLRKALTLAVDGTDLQEIRKMMELEIIVAEQRAEAEAKVFESAGGYSPTIGIIGAVLGLILVMGIWAIWTKWALVSPAHSSLPFTASASPTSSASQRAPRSRPACTSKRS